MPDAALKFSRPLSGSFLESRGRARLNLLVDVDTIVCAQRIHIVTISRAEIATSVVLRPTSRPVAVAHNKQQLQTRPIAKQPRTMGQRVRTFAP